MDKQFYHVFAGEDTADALGGMGDYVGTFYAEDALREIKSYKSGWVEFVIVKNDELVTVAYWGDPELDEILRVDQPEGEALKATLRWLIKSHQF